MLPSVTANEKTDAQIELAYFGFVSEAYLRSIKVSDELRPTRDAGNFLKPTALRGSNNPLGYYTGPPRGEVKTIPMMLSPDMMPMSM
jgi:hypothetical protein